MLCGIKASYPFIFKRVLNNIWGCVEIFSMWVTQVLHVGQKLFQVTCTLHSESY